MDKLHIPSKSAEEDGTPQDSGSPNALDALHVAMRFLVKQSPRFATGRAALARSISQELNRSPHGAMADHANLVPPWAVEDSSTLYRVPGWGAPYYLVNSKGHMAVRPNATEDGSDELDLLDLIGDLRRRQVELPLIIRFPEIMQCQMQTLQDCFESAIASQGYQGRFQGVFPVKCNQDRYLIQDIVEYGRKIRFGLEAGSKPELLVAISHLKDSPDALLICNGYKDEGYMEIVILARQLGINAIIVLEQMDELSRVIKVSHQLDVKPMIGVRAKLTTKHEGHWGSTSGDRGKFGLTASEIVRVVYKLRQENMLDCLSLLHFHIGSQIPSISIIKEAMREASHLYCELALMGAPMGHVDVGGGLGIDYDGTKNHVSGSSTNYSMQNYANDVVAALLDACVVKNVPQPMITSESGRALASCHSVLVFDVLNTNEHTAADAQGNLRLLLENHAPGLGYPKGSSRVAARHSGGGGGMRQELRAGEYLLSNFYDVLETIDEENFQEAYNDAKQYKQETTSLFKLGILSLEQRAQADNLYTAVCHKVLQVAQSQPDVPQELLSLAESMASVYHINLSIFRSVVDSWAINQLFPICPLQRLDEQPKVMATLADLTCDSDGRINRFIGGVNGPSSVLPVHESKAGEPYLLGLFLAGVYQEVMGSLHNLFGAVNVVIVRSKNANQPSKGAEAKASVQAPRASNGMAAAGPTKLKYYVEHVVKGQAMQEVLRTVQHDAKDMIESVRLATEDAVEDGRLTLEAAASLLNNYKKSLNAYTYLISS